MKRLAFLLPALAALLVACPNVKGPAGTNPPDAAFSGFTNATSQVTVSPSLGLVPQTFIATVRASSDNQVASTQCYLDATPVGGTSTTFQRECVYDSVTPGPHTLRVEATDQYGNVSGTDTNVTVVAGTPSLTSGVVGSTALNLALSGALVPVSTGTGPSLTFQAAPGGAPITSTYVKVNDVTVATAKTATLTTTLQPVNAPESVTLGAQDAVGNRSEYRFMLNPQDTASGDQSSPIVAISSPANNAAVQGTINVSVQAGHPNGIEKVELLRDGGLTATATAAPYTFSLDTTTLSNGTHTLAAVATSNNGLSAQSTAVTISVQNVQPPLLAITSPAANSTIQAVQPVTVSVTKRASDFTFSGPITVTFTDYRGSVVASQVVNAANDTDGTYTTAPFDLSAFANDAYTISASATVSVSGLTSPQTLSATIGVSTKNSSLVPPAVIVTNPVRVTPDQSTKPTFGDAGFGYVFAEVSDNTGVSHVELRMTCDTCGNGGPVNALEGYVAYTTAATAAAPILRFDMDGTPYLPDGDYTARVVAQDVDGNRNIQEIQVKLDRTKHTAGLYPVLLTKGPDNLGAKLSPGSASYTISGLNTLDNYRVGEVVLDPKGNPAVGQSVFGGQGSETFAEAFNLDGAWLFYAQAEDLNTAHPLVVPTSRLVQIVTKLQ